MTQSSIAALRRPQSASSRRCRADRDFIVRGWNFDSDQLFELMPGVPCLRCFDEEQIRAGTAAFQDRAVMPQVSICSARSASRIRRSLPS